MGISLKILASGIIAFVVIVVAGACLGVTLGTAISSINNVGEAWAKGVSHSITNDLQNYYDSWGNDLISASALLQSKNLTMPSIMVREGRENWTSTWLPFLLKLASQKNYSNEVALIGFFDYYWIYNEKSEFDPSLQKTEWFENFENDITKMHGGGFLYHRDTMLRAPYTNGSNYDLEVYANNARTYLVADPLILSGLEQKKKKYPTALSTCTWTPSLHLYVVGDAIRNFESYMFCLVNDINRASIGLVSISINTVVELGRVLLVSRKSPHAEIFILQKGAEIMATTRPEKFFTLSMTTVSARIPLHCYSSIVPLPQILPPRLGCLDTVDTFPYPPLNAIGSAFAMTDTYNFDFFKVDGTIYAIAAERMTTAVGDLSLNTITVLPEEDLFYGTINNSIALSSGLTVAVAAVAIGLALIVLNFVVRRLENVHAKMLRLSELNDFDRDDGLLDQDDNDINNNGNSHPSSSETVNEENDVVGEFFKNDDTMKKTRGLQINMKNESQQQEDEEDEKDNSWIAEVKNLEKAYAATVRSMTNFTRYVSRAVVKELILQRRRSQIAAHHEDDNDEAAANKQLQHQEKKGETAAADSSSPAPNSSQYAGIVSGIDNQQKAAEYEVTVLIADIEGFSSQIWKTNSANHDGVLYILHIYFKRMTRLIMGHGGIVDKFMGDSIMSYWGAPVKNENHAFLAVLAALSLLRETRRNPLKRIFERTVGRDVKLRCGISSGTAVVGTFGNAESVNYSIIGTPVLLARHLEDFNKCWSSSILMNGDCMRKVDETIIHRYICQAKFEPTAKPEYVYEVMGLNLDSPLARAKVSLDIRTIAFTDVLSLATMQSRNEGVQEILCATSPEHESTIDALLNWHAKGRSALPASFVSYAEQFSEASRALTDQRFKEAFDLFTKLQESHEHRHGRDATSSSDPSSSSSEKSTSDSDRPLNNSTSNNTSSGGTTENWQPRLIFSIANDQPLKNLLAISKIYTTKKPLAQAIDPETKTLFVRAFKLDSLQMKSNNNNNKNNNNNDHVPERKTPSKNRKDEKVSHNSRSSSSNSSVGSNRSDDNKNNKKSESKKHRSSKSEKKNRESSLHAKNAEVNNVSLPNQIP